MLTAEMFAVNILFRRANDRSKKWKVKLDALPFFVFVEKMKRYDQAELVGKISKTDEGYLRGSAIVTRTGVFDYLNADGSIRRELRHPDHVFSKDSLSSLKMIPVTNNHPDERMVNAQNADRLSIGQTGESVAVDGRYVIASMTITHSD